MSWQVTECRSCDAPIIWAYSKNQKLMPIDAEPCDDGNVELREQSGIPQAEVHSQPPMGVDKLYKSHYASCPNASQWRR